MFSLGLLKVDECDVIPLGESGPSLDDSIQTISQNKHFNFQLKWLFITTYKDAPIAGLQYLLEYHMLVLFLSSLWNKEMTLPRFEPGTSRVNSCKAMTLPLS